MCTLWKILGLYVATPFEVRSSDLPLINAPTPWQHALVYLRPSPSSTASSTYLNNRISRFPESRMSVNNTHIAQRQKNPGAKTLWHSNASPEVSRTLGHAIMVIGLSCQTVPHALGSKAYKLTAHHHAYHLHQYICFTLFLKLLVTLQKSSRSLSHQAAKAAKL